MLKFAAMHKLLSRLALVSLVSIFLVIMAGSVVRMTGSGMGCPDWPKCFGYYIPPTNIETLTWQEGRQFEKGNIIIKDESLLVAKADFVAGAQFETGNWEVYTKHDYAIFNPVHTWTEFINRLLGALSGLPVLGFFLVSIFFFKRDPLVTILGLTGVLLLGFEAWLGKIVVDGNLVPHQITYHMFGAIALVALYIFLYVRLDKKVLVFRAIRDKMIIRLGLAAMGIILFQIFLGTTVREEIDLIGKSHLLSYSDWTEQLSIFFKFHRSFSIAVLVVVGYFAIRVVRTRTISTLPRLLLVAIVLEVLLGMGLAYLNLPAILQPLHLLFAVADFGLIFVIVLVYLKKTKADIVL